MTIVPARAERRPARARSWLLPLVIVLVFLACTAAVMALTRIEVHYGTTSSAATIEGSGVPAEEVRQVPRFRQVVLTGSNEVLLRIGRPQSVVVHADDNLLSHVTTEVDAGTLTIGDKPGAVEANAPRMVGITVPSVDALTLGGSGSIVAGGLDARSLTVLLSGSGTVGARGKTQRLGVTISGAGEADLSQLVARHVKATVSGAGQIAVHATASLDASVPGTGEIVYAGNPAHVTRTVTGTGAITTP